MSEKFSPQQAAKYLGFSVPTLERWRRSGVGPKFVKLGGNRVAYLQKHLDEYVESRVQTPALEGQP
ncbi:MAG: helix-turn-helix domain-containing protein [Terricaulis sp.]